MPTLWIFDIEPHEQRYTAQWKKHLPLQLKNYTAENRYNNWIVSVVRTIDTSDELPDGAFLNYAETNLYKAYQVAAFSKCVSSGSVQKGDRVLFADAWHPGVIHCRYMDHMLRLGIEIHVMWHAGSYDKYDQLGQRHHPHKKWSYAFEKAVYEAADKNYFATNFHKELFFDQIRPYKQQTARIVGWPMEYLPELLKDKYKTNPKDTIVFPHRLSKEKQPYILENLEPHLTNYDVVFAQQTKLKKSEYHALLGRSLACFSASHQETLGIGTYEAMLCGAVPIVPCRLSYKEMYGQLCYPSDWTEHPKKAEKNSKNLVRFIENAIAKHTPEQMHKAALEIGEKYFDGEKLYDHLFGK